MPIDKPKPAEKEFNPEAEGGEGSLEHVIAQGPDESSRETPGGGAEALAQAEGAGERPQVVDIKDYLKAPHAPGSEPAASKFGHLTLEEQKILLNDILAGKNTLSANDQHALLESIHEQRAEDSDLEQAA